MGGESFPVRSTRKPDAILEKASGFPLWASDFCYSLAQCLVCKKVSVEHCTTVCKTLSSIIFLYTEFPFQMHGSSPEQNITQRLRSQPS